MTFLQWIKAELAMLRKEKLCSEGCKGQDYWRGYRDALQTARETYRSEKGA